VHGAARDALAYARGAIVIEANRPRPTTPWSSSDTGEIVSGGNFHGAPIAIAADVLVLGLVQLATISSAARIASSIPRSVACPRF
jgi:histidine ammonia-lyase